LNVALTYVLLDYKTLIVPSGAWLVAQFIKVIIASVQDRRPRFSYMASMGGMPSAHSATVCSLAATIGISNGFTSAVFAISAFFALLVMYDAGGVRRTVSSHSGMINRMLDELFRGNPEFELRFREIIGHNRLEIAAGAILGILLALWWT
jgi:acid phosphatase family membrane protein YuiD